MNNNPLADLHAQSFRLSVVKRTFDTNVNIRLAGLVLDDCTMQPHLRLAESGHSELPVP